MQLRALCIELHKFMIMFLILFGANRPQVSSTPVSSYVSCNLDGGLLLVEWVGTTVTLIESGAVTMGW